MALRHVEKLVSHEDKASNGKQWQDNGKTMARQWQDNGKTLARQWQDNANQGTRERRKFSESTFFRLINSADGSVCNIYLHCKTRIHCDRRRFCKSSTSRNLNL